MAVEGATQALIAAFFFGIVLNAASAALVLYLRGYGLAAVFRDSQRLVLVLFLLSAALWAQIDFIAILLDITTSPTPCQISLIFSSIFDQFARFSIEQFLLWALNTDNGGKLSVTQLIPQVLVLARFLAGAVFIGFTRPQTDTFCVATTSAMPVGITVTALDGAIVLLLIIRAYSARGVAKDNREGKGVDSDRARALLSVLLGLAFWTGNPLVFVASGAGTLLTSRATDSRQPEAPSPRRINISRDISTSDTDYPPSRFEDLKEAALRSSTTFVNPREAPRVKDETSVKYYPFGMETAFHNEPMPPLPASIIPASELARRLDRSASHKKHVFDFGKGKITIGHPVLQDNVGQNPLSKIAVMDLKEAAMADRERRAKMHEDERVAVGRSAGPLMGMAPEEVLKRGVSLKRKEVASVSIRESVFPGALHHEDVAVGSSTSAQLSPGGEETRRRSPRQSLQEELVQPRQASPVQARSASPQNLPLTTQKPLLIPNIRPSRMLPAEPKAPPPEPTKTPLQRRPTIGLPSNPRARGVQVAEEHGSQHRTILFVNNIEYDDPLAVEAIIKTAGYTATKQAPTAETPRTSRSVVNRPRPIPRKVSDESAQSSPALAHRRSKSGGSLIGRKSLLAPSPGSPTRLPPLPTLPRSATVAARPQPNDTKSMTFDEKVTLLFPTPPSANAAKRRSPVPNVPLIPASYLDADSSPSEPLDRNHSNRTTRTSVRTESVLQVDEISWKQGNAVVNTADAASSSWLRAFGDNKKRRSSPVIPAAVVRASAWTETTYDRSEDDATNWSQVNSPELAVSVPVAQRLGLPLSIRMPAHQDMRGSQLFFADNRSRETLPIMLDTSTVQQADFQEPPVPEVEVGATPELPTWHRRVGDRCPTFSNRKEKTKSKSRKMAPPAPLSLNTIASTKILAIQVEPSPLESPEQAIRQIQAQLKKLEELDHASPQSATRRIALLEDLEREMGQQADHWLEIKHDMGRDSLSSMQTTSPSRQSSRRESVASTVHVARESLRQSIGAERRASRNSRLRVGGNPPKVPDATVRNSVSPHLSNWQKRLTEAQMDYVDARLLRRTSNVNLLQLSRAQLASPTPPDSDDSSEAEASPFPSSPEEIQVEQFLEEAHPNSLSLWTQAPKDSASPTGFLWAPVLKPVPGIETRLPAPPAQPLVRVPSKTTAPSQKPPRPVTQRPPRRSKRVTLLPDIIENPEPLPDKRGTLGIFQFPWGEKSNTASMQPRPSVYMAMPGTMTTGGPSLGAAADSRSTQFEQTEYSSSFFDDYDDEVEMDSDEEGSDDGFDDSTLWEIASLLKTDSVPSRDSLLPTPSESVVGDYIDELTSDEEGLSSREQSIVIGLAEPRELFFEQQRDSATLENATLSMLEDALESETPPKPAVRIGLPANPRAALQVSRAVASEAAPAPEMSRMARDTAEVQGAENAQKQGSTGLWYPPNRADETSSRRGFQADKPSRRGGLFVPGSNRSGYRGTSEEPAAKYMSRKPRPTERKPLDGLASTDLWASADVAKQTARNWIKHQESRKTPARHYQRPQVSREDWKSALKEAIAASYPHTGKVKRVTASPAEWNAALQEAISLSARHPAFDSPTRHPVFAASSLVTRSEWPHPAAAGYTNDVSAAVHPIFSEEGEQQEEEVPAFPVQQQETSPWQQGVNNSHNSAIQAQIEALEQERLFVERAAKEEYLRRTTALPPTVMMVVEVEEEAMLAGGGDTTVQDLQRRLSQRIRQSLVFSPSPAPPLPLAVTMIKPELLAAVSRSGSTKKSKTSAQIELSGGALLWTAQTSSSSSSSSTGMWSAASVRLSSAGLSRAAEEDAEVAVQRARRRRVMQKLQRRQEILAQIAAVEAGMNPFVDFAGMGMWVGSSKGGVVVEEGRDWLHSVCVVKKVTRGVRGCWGWSQARSGDALLIFLWEY
ncbi:hypothetical protein C8A00DRAFT_40513 [Chaetomidium leptoderma]|uniref:Uncharacterized protein n=1 Tax=Chaetomidium leptoderma TaxID=669021 RepID=A0AAN6VTA9_9PEZI|nr:hypothetical protein C8A00DRAFT_40513 [Chaetomidium leptoderma]